MPKLKYNLYVIADRKHVIEPKAINRSIGHSMKLLKAKKGVKYTIIVANWADATVESDFQIGTYAEK